MMKNIPGVTILSGPQDWQIFQRNQEGTAAIHLEGTWSIDEEVPGYSVQARLVDENSGLPVTRSLDWSDATLDFETRRFSLNLEKVPQGGLYRVETRVKRPFAADARALRGDYIHHLGVGDIYVIAGQSNASGTSKGITADGPALGIHVFANDETWKLATHPLEDATGTLHPITVTGVFHGHSPWLAFGKFLYRRTGIPVGLIPTALGGSPISRWVKNAKGVGDVFDNMLEMIQKAGGAVAGILWFQGESDVFLDRVDSYSKNFKQLVSATREILQNPKLPFLTAQISCYRETVDEDKWSRMREIQRTLSHEVEGVRLVVTVDCIRSDEGHLSAGSNIWVGERFAQVALEHIYGAQILASFPEVESVRFTDETRQTLELEFCNVSGDWTPNPSTTDFAVKDREGWLPVQHLDLKKCPKVILTLDRPAVGRTAVNGLYGVDPRPTLFDDNGRCIVPFSLYID